VATARYRTPNWGPEEPATLAALESLRPLGVEPPQTERTQRFLRSLQDEDGGVGQRHRAISTLHDVWIGLDVARLLDALREDRS
jgi:hypothetical protein